MIGAAPPPPAAHGPDAVGAKGSTVAEVHSEGDTAARADDAHPDADAKPLVTIKKYANRRLYNTSSSSYVTLDHLSEMVREGVDFVVQDAKSGEDITRSVLGQIIFEQENRGQNLLPVQFLRRLIRLYGDNMQSFLPPYLEMSMEAFARSQEQWREQMKRAWTGPMSATPQIAAPPLAGKGARSPLDEHTRNNLALFEQAIRLWSPYTGQGAAAPAKPAAAEPAPPQPAGGADALAELKRQLDAMQKQIDQLSAPGARKP